ncbi:uncharacterized protein ColSpa_10495 [Colletotrichum spaethianum]|uniref:F-box domain-containing protein n=1 Tax=Colletotrichum spaethianum TaxID=700344 RepID=A0AA37PDP8_9PEZI|nr:uncharacterized protein ColSpa_10495 [Colletotrichum spaethianum]GKT50314.1 hypothetical protein ColSpa_10495 [Colletotrichum spaethianum]
MAFKASLTLNAMPAEILDLIFASLSPIALWHLRRTSKRFNAILHPHLLSTLRAMADPPPLTLIRETAPVPLSFIYSFVLAVLGDNEGRKLRGRNFPSRDTSLENPYSSWLPDTPPPASSPSLADQEPSPSTIRRQNEINAYSDIFIPHLRSSSPSLANLRRIHFWSILLWYKEWSFMSSSPSPAKVDKARKDRFHWAYKQHRSNCKEQARRHTGHRGRVHKGVYLAPPLRSTGSAAFGQRQSLFIPEVEEAARLWCISAGTGPLDLRFHPAG